LRHVLVQILVLVQNHALRLALLALVTVHALLVLVTVHVLLALAILAVTNAARKNVPGGKFLKTNAVVKDAMTAAVLVKDATGGNFGKIDVV